MHYFLQISVPSCEPGTELHPQHSNPLEFLKMFLSMENLACDPVPGKNALWCRMFFSTFKVLLSPLLSHVFLLWANNPIFSFEQISLKVQVLFKWNLGTGVHSREQRDKLVAGLWFFSAETMRQLLSASSPIQIGQIPRRNSLPQQKTTWSTNSGLSVSDSLLLLT